MAPNTAKQKKKKPIWLKKMLGNKKFCIGGVLLLIIVFMAIFAPYLTKYDYSAMKVGKLCERPSAAHILGTDNFGRDVFTRVVYGARISLLVSLTCMLLSVLIGTTIGLISGFVGGLFDVIIMRLSDLLTSIPSVLLAVTVSSFIGEGLQVVIAAITASFLPGAIRLARSLVLSIREREYVQAAIVIGEKKSTILFRYILPNCVAPIIVQTTGRLASAVLGEAAISYLGYGTQPPTPSWGLMLSDSQGLMWKAPYLCIIPGVAIIILVLAANLFGDGLRDLLDPKYRG